MVNPCWRISIIFLIRLFLLKMSFWLWVRFFLNLWTSHVTCLSYQILLNDQWIQIYGLLSFSLWCEGLSYIQTHWSRWPPWGRLWMLNTNVHSKTVPVLRDYLLVWSVSSTFLHYALTDRQGCLNACSLDLIKPTRKRLYLFHYCSRQ